MKTLDARLVIDGPWEGAPVRATKHTGKVVDGVAVKRFTSGGGWRVSPTGATNRIIIAADSSAVWTLELRLPGPRGLGLAGLEWACRRRTKGWAEQPGLKPAWFREALGRAIIEDRQWPWLSRYLAMTDALAAAQGWPTGEGAPVYRWTKVGKGWCLGTVGAPRTARGIGYGARGIRPVPALEGITDPMAALEAVWTQRCGP